MKLTKPQKGEIIGITISVISLIVSYLLSINYIAIIAVIFCGIPIFKECIEGLIKEFDIKADLLVTLAIISSIIIGEIFAAGEIATIMAIGGFLEEYTVLKTRNKLEKLVKMTPKKAIRIRNSIEEKIDVEKIEIDDILKVLPGESIPTDGRIINGETSVDESTLTGESLPVDKKVNDEVYSGTINLYGSFTMQTTKISKDSTIQKLIKLVESSKPENANIVKTADKWATLIVVIAFTAAVLTYLVTFEITRSVTILVVFCPCALVLATPTAIMAAIGNLTKHGILIKDGQSLEELARIDEIAFDKTGTLTYGRPNVTRIISKNKKEMMYLLASLESKSEHPIGKSIVKYYNSTDLAEVRDFKIEFGKGIKGIIDDAEVIAGNRDFIKSQNISLNDTKQQKNGEIEIYVVKNKEIIGKVLLADTIRETSKETITALKRLKVRSVLLTGDNRKTAEIIAKKAGIIKVRPECLPEDKLEYIKEEQVKGNYMAMIGDGINDAPSLRKANVGIAMGQIGSDISVEAADIALVNDNIKDIPHIIGIARKTIKTINISIAFALLLNMTAMALAIMGLLNPIEGALIHNIGSVIVIVYSSTLMRYRLPKKYYQKLGITKTINNQRTYINNYKFIR